MSDQPIHPEHQYLKLLTDVLGGGDQRIDRTGVGTQALFGAQMRFNLADGFPCLTTKRVFWKLAFKEMLWMLSGSTRLRDLLVQGVSIWTDWPLDRYRRATGEQLSMQEFEGRILTDDAFDAAWGDLGPVYGKQWRAWETKDGRKVDQVQGVIDLIKHNPTSRRILWDAWNVGELGEMALPPCHKHYQFFVNQKTGTLSMALVARSQDLFLGTPFNICNAALLVHLMAAQTGLTPGELVWYGMDVHIYQNHHDAVKTQLARTPRELPRLELGRVPDSLFGYKIEDLRLVGYDPHPAIKADVAV